MVSSSPSMKQTPSVRRTNTSKDRQKPSQESGSKVEMTHDNDLMSSSSREIVTLRQHRVEKEETYISDAKNVNSSLPITSTKPREDKNIVDRDDVEQDDQTQSINSTSSTESIEAPDPGQYLRKIKQLSLMANYHLQQKNLKLSLQKYNELLFVVSSLHKHSISRRPIVNDKGRNAVYYQNLTAEVLYRLAMIYESTHDWKLALDKYHKALSLYQRSKNDFEGGQKDENNMLRYSVAQVDERMKRIATRIDLIRARPCDQSNASEQKSLPPSTKNSEKPKVSTRPYLTSRTSWSDDSGGIPEYLASGEGDSDLPSLRHSFEVKADQNEEVDQIEQVDSLQPSCTDCSMILHGMHVYIYTSYQNMIEALKRGPIPIPKDIVLDDDNQTAQSSITGCQYTSDHQPMSVELLHVMPRNDRYTGML